MDKSPRKNQKFIQPRKSKKPLYVTLTIITLALAAGGYYLISSKNPLEAKTVASVGQKISYSTSEQFQQTRVPSKVENGNVVVTTLSTLKNDKFIWTEYKSAARRVPLTALIQPDGRILVAVSICEPCRSETFHIKGNELICNTCGTVWDLQTLKGKSGACQPYPPDALTYSVNGDNLEVPQSVLDNWKPRV